MERSVQELLDKQAIGEVIARYARTLDWLDEAGQARCYWPDGAIDYGFFVGTGADFVPVVMEIERRSARRWHMISGLIIRLTSATTASTESYGLFAGASEADDGSLAGRLIGGRYLDEFEKRGGEWRIAKRVYLRDWELPLPDQPSFVADPAFPLPTVRIDRPGHPLFRAL